MDPLLFPLARISADSAPNAFPPAEYAWPPESEAPGLLAVGGDLSPERLAAAYGRGIFPWYSEGEPVLWWSPDPRMVLYTAEFRFARSLRKTLQHFLATPGCEIRMDHNFRGVITACSQTPRAGQDGTWIMPEMIEAYVRLHQAGTAHSLETWVDGELVGGLYGVGLGGMFFGESMFAHRTDASKLALCGLIAFARAQGIRLIDCQQKTRHLSSLGGREVPRAQFLVESAAQQQQPTPPWQDQRIAPETWHTLLP